MLKKQISIMSLFALSGIASGCYVQTREVVTVETTARPQATQTVVVTSRPSAPVMVDRPVIVDRPVYIPSPPQPTATVTITPPAYPVYVPAPQPTAIVTVTPSYPDYNQGNSGGYYDPTPGYSDGYDSTPSYDNSYGDNYNYPDYSYDYPSQNYTTSCSYDAYGSEICDVYTYNEEGEIVPVRDITTVATVLHQKKVNDLSSKYTEQFSLNEKQSNKLAELVADFTTLETRSDADLKDFALRAYGVNPHDIVAAVSKAQLGDQSKLSELISESARSFETTPDNMKNIIKTLHGDALEKQGIDLD